MANKDYDSRHNHGHTRDRYNDSTYNTFDGDDAQDRMSQRRASSPHLERYASGQAWNDRSAQHYENENADRFNRDRHGSDTWDSNDYNDRDYRSDFDHRSKGGGYGERYGFSGYGRSHYNPDMNRNWQEDRDVSTWRNERPFNNREQDYRGGQWDRSSRSYNSGRGEQSMEESRFNRGGWREGMDYNTPSERDFGSHDGMGYNSGSNSGNQSGYAGGNSGSNYNGGNSGSNSGNSNGGSSNYGSSNSAGSNSGGSSYGSSNDNTSNSGSRSGMIGGMSGSGSFGNSGGMNSRGQYSGVGPKNYRRNDDRIHEDVCERLSDHPEIDASEIEVRVSNGEVTLSGSVTERNMKRRAEDVIESVQGVKDVNNQIRVSTTSGNSNRENRDGYNREGSSNERRGSNFESHANGHFGETGTNRSRSMTTA